MRANNNSKCFIYVKDILIQIYIYIWLYKKKCDISVCLDEQILITSFKKRTVFEEILQEN